MNIQAKPDTYTTKRGTPAKRITFQWTQEKIALAAKLWQEGFTGPAIAERMGVARGSVTAIASQHRDQFPSRLTKGKKSEDGRHVDIPAYWLERAAELWMLGNNANKIAKITGVKVVRPTPELQRGLICFPSIGIVIRCDPFATKPYSAMILSFTTPSGCTSPARFTPCRGFRSSTARRGEDGSAGQIGR